MKINDCARQALLALATAFLIAACGGGSDGGDPPPPPAPDTTDPTVSDVGNAGGATLNRTTTLSVTASDNVAVTDVRFFVNGELLGNDASAPFEIEWDTSTVADGDHVLSAEAEDAAGNVGESGEVTVTVQNAVAYAVALTGAEEVPPTESAGAADADLTVNLATGAVSGDLAVTGITPTDAHIHAAFAGANGGVLVPLEQDAGDPGAFTVPDGATLDAAGLDALLAGGLYVNVHTDAFPGGEIRGQILPVGFELYFADLAAENENPAVDSPASGRAGLTFDPASGALVVQVQTEGLDDASDAHVHEGYAGSNGPVLVPLTQDGADPGHWFVEDGTLNEAGADALAAGRLYVNVHSPDNPGGEIRGQVLPEGIVVLRSELTGAQEVPAVETNAAGVAYVTLDEAGSLASIHANTAGLADATMAHLHTAFGGVNGPVTIGLTQDGGNAEHWFAEEQALTAEQLAALLAGETYVNVHSPANPGGEIRGQVIPQGILFANGRLEGAQEVPPVTSDAGGTFAVTVDPATMTLTAHANTTGADDATMAHLHDGYAGESGGVAIGLTQDGADVTHWLVEDAALSAEQLAALSAGGMYVNVHTPANPPGEIRGQVAPPPVEVLFAEMSGAQEVPAVASAALATAAATVNRDTGSVSLHLNATGADDATAAHIHSAYAGTNGGVVVPLEQDAGNVGHWFAEGAALDEAGLADYLGGRLYVNLHTPANPGGEIRAQLVPEDIQLVFGELSGAAIVPPVTTTAGGAAAATTNLQTREFFAALNTTDADDASSAGVRVGAEGVNGEGLLPLLQTAMQPAQWTGMTTLDDEAFSAYRAGRLYAIVRTPTEPDGELRAQIVPPDAADFDDVAPTVSLTSPSPGDTVSGTITITADASDNNGVETVRFFAGDTLLGSDPSAPYSFDWDTTEEANGAVQLSAEAEDAVGNIGTSDTVEVTVENAEPVTLTSIQESVFSSQCAGCHNGSGGDLPGAMDLRNTAASYAALVDTPSIQQPALDRVAPGDPDDSYLIRKLEGGPGITGTQMPQGSPPLSQATIDMIRQWITDGALNN